MIQLHHVALSVADVERAIAWYGDALDVHELLPVHDRPVAVGATGMWDPRPSPERGKAMAFVQDPEGNLIELIGPLTEAIAAAHPAAHPAAHGAH